MKGSLKWGPGCRVPEEVRFEIRERGRRGELRRVLQQEFCLSRVSVWRIVNEHGPMLSEVCSRSSRCLSAGDREVISREVRAGTPDAAIARLVGCHRSTIGREIAGHGGRQNYRAVNAEQRACGSAKRPKPTKLESCPLLASVVTRWLRHEQWSPEQISARLVVEFPDDETMRVSKETIYLELFVYGRGGLKKELIKHLRTQRPQRKPRSITARNSQGPIPNMVLIEDRPAEVDDRVVPGHWEGDLIIGANSASQVGTLVERTTGWLMLVQLPEDRCAPTVAAALQRQVQTLPAQLCKSITWDQGREMAAHEAFSIAADVAVYFCHPHSPWERGSNENTNGLLRQYLPKGTDLSGHSQADLDAIARKLNDRPRKRHGFLTPSEVFSQLVLQ